MVHMLLADKAPPLSLMPVSPTFNPPSPASVSVPPQVLVVVMFARVRLAGKVSVKPMPVNARVVGFASLTVRTDVPPGTIAFGLKDLLIVMTDGSIMVAMREPVL